MWTFIAGQRSDGGHGSTPYDPAPGGLLPGMRDGVRAASD
jgi:hypothetical protein